MGDKKKSVGIGLMGLGVVGSKVAELLLERQETLAYHLEVPLTLKKILVRDPLKPRPLKVEFPLITTKAEEILDNPDVVIVIEVIGGEQPALEYIKVALSKGKHVVTANKEIMAKYGFELLNLAQRNKVSLRYEASVGGGIPLIAPFYRDLIGNDISAIYAIVNGTTNYILTRMDQDGLDFPLALKEAQELGYAEPDPSNDVNGLDAAYKLAILATLAFRTKVSPEDVYCEGISKLRSRDFRYAKELNYSIKLLAIAKVDNGAIEVRVHPVFIPENFLLAKVNGVYNAVQVEGDLVGKVIFYGEGAGALPTSSAVIGDVIAIARNIVQGISEIPRLPLGKTRTIKPMSEIETRYYMRMNVADRPGVLAQISKVLGDHLISISSVIQKESDPRAKTAEIVIMTHPAKEELVQKALRAMAHLPVVEEISNFVRVEA